MIKIERTKLKVMIVENGKKPYIKDIPRNLDGFRNIIGNTYIGVTDYKDVLIIYDENALIKRLEINRHIDSKVIRGTFIICGNDEYEKDFKDLTEEQIKKYSEQFTLYKEEELEIE